MKMKEIVLVCFISVTIVSCDSTRTLYTSSKSKRDYWTVKAYTMSHCGCTHLYVENFEKGRHVSQIQYQNEGAAKRIFTYNDQGEIGNTIILFAAKDNPIVPFDSLDRQIFLQLKKIIERREGIVYDLKWTEYKGYSINSK